MRGLSVCDLFEGYLLVQNIKIVFQISLVTSIVVCVRGGANAYEVPRLTVEAGAGHTVFINSTTDDTGNWNSAIVCNITRAPPMAPTQLPSVCQAEKPTA